mmetsp:Transcript_37737/g.91789  ORF Transcript_37737/g.91789 Transcript_37737/m.91789 type:complete len:148 (+) Transcript_37737:747-1190(+)
MLLLLEPEDVVDHANEVCSCVDFWKEEVVQRRDCLGCLPADTLDVPVEGAAPFIGLVLMMGSVGWTWTPEGWELLRLRRGGGLAAAGLATSRLTDGGAVATDVAHEGVELASLASLLSVSLELSLQLVSRRLFRGRRWRKTETRLAS